MSSAIRSGAADLGLEVAGIEYATLSSAGLAVTNDVAPTRGVKFPATQNPSSDVNTLDDYEEGTWAPNNTGLTIVGSPTTTGHYTKIGRQVTVTVKIAGATSIGTTANTSICTNLPFTVLTGSNAVGGMNNAGYTAFTGVVAFETSSSAYSVGTLAQGAACNWSITYFTS